MFKLGENYDSVSTIPYTPQITLFTFLLQLNENNTNHDPKIIISYYRLLWRRKSKFSNYLVGSRVKLFFQEQLG